MVGRRAGSARRAFPVWGLIVAAVLFIVGGFFGVPHAVFTGILLWRAAQDVWFVPISVGALALAWGGAVFLNLALYGTALGPPIGAPPDDRRNIFLFAAALWHLQMIAALAVWADRRIVLLHAPIGRCAACGYDLAGLTGMISPECGRAGALPAPAAERVGVTTGDA